MPLDRPTHQELRQVLDHYAASGQRSAYLDRVAAHLEALLLRETSPAEDPAGASAQARETARLRHVLGKDGTLDALHRQLCEQIRAGAVSWQDAALRAHLRQSVADKLAIDNPRYS